jgi:hypothetical protein
METPVWDGKNAREMVILARNLESRIMMRNDITTGGD